MSCWRSAPNSPSLMHPLIACGVHLRAGFALYMVLMLHSCTLFSNMVDEHRAAVMQERSLTLALWVPLPLLLRSGTDALPCLASQVCTLLSQIFALLEAAEVFSVLPCLCSHHVLLCACGA